MSRTVLRQSLDAAPAERLGKVIDWEARLLFGRRTGSESAADEADLDHVETDAASGKGRPTPKRKDAQAARKKRLTPPRSRKEANALHRERMKEQRLKQRQALAGGDDKYLPARDRGPVKGYIRDYVDSHRTIGEYLIPIFIAVLIAGIVLTPVTASVPILSSIPWVIVLSGLAVDSLRIMRGVKLGITQRFGADKTKGITFYTLMRSWQMRRLRLPKPRIGRGAEI